MKEGFLKAIGKMVYGIYVLTASYKDEINAMIAS
jgi:flavin reductase (DIM6/NTAB) family NADH-FMN oxidoreductase RutF